MDTTEPLFDLIKALTTSEKGYFKKQSSNSSYLLLFDQINGMKSYDEQKLIGRLKGRIRAVNLPVMKNYLYESVLRALRAYHAGRHSETVLDEMIQNLRILYDKAQYDACEKLLRKGKAMAASLELFGHHLQLLSFEYSFNQFKLRDSESTFGEEQRVVAAVSSNNRINRVYSRLLMWVFRNERVKTPEEREEVEQILREPVLREEPLSFTFHGRNTLFGTWCLYYYLTGNSRMATTFKIKQLENYLANDGMKTANGKVFLLVLGNVLTLCYDLGETELFDRYYRVMKEQHTAVSGNEMLKLEQQLSFGMLYHKMKDHRTGIRFAEENEAVILENSSRMSLIKYLDICFNACLFHFRDANYKRALHWLNRVLQDEKVEERQHIHCSARIIELIIHYEMENVELLESLMRSTHRYLYKRNKIYEFENIFLAFLKNMARDYYDDGKRKMHFDSLEQNLERIGKDAFQKHSISHFDYLGWLARKRPGSEVHTPGIITG
jgi:hypothetical protein